MKVRYRNKFKKPFQKFISYLITGSCLIFVTWQTIKCMTKYIKKPQGTTVSMKKSANLSFPAITICGLSENDAGLNETYLQNICGLSFSNYYWSGQWANSNCSDPKELYEAIIFKPEDIIDAIEFTYWTKSNATFYSSIHEFKDWSYHDYEGYGRCVSLAPSHEHSQHGIKEIYLALGVNSTIFIHTPGMFIKGSEQLMFISYVELGKWYIKSINYEMHELLDYGGETCNNEKSYHIDDCNAKGVGMKSLELVGCTNPYVLNKTKICTDINKSEKANDIYGKFMYSNSEMNYEGCYYPCSYFIVPGKNYQESDSEDLEYAQIILRFEQLIKETKSYYTYSGLSLIAEIGGYVGLFLGISINQLTNLWDILDLLFTKICSHFQ